ncbi:MAG: sugar ABC transporter permease [Alphaproteobacteria bacterium]
MKGQLVFWRCVFLALPLGVYGAIVIWPLADSFFHSITNWNGFNPDYKLVWFDNFGRVFTDPLFYGAILRTAIWIAAAIVLPTGGGLALALLLDGGLRGARIYKSLFYLPICLSAVVVGQVWIWIFEPGWGLLNTALDGVGLDGLRTAWLADPDTSLASVIAAWSWQQTGLAMVIFLSGLTAIPAELTEAAAIDGASRGQRIRYVTLPMLRPATIVAVALSVINALKGFDIVWIMTEGGPFHSSETLAVFMYTESFKKYAMGYGSAIAVVLFLMTLVIIALYFRTLRRLDALFG